MASDESALFSREGVLGGLSARRATTLLFAIENRTAHLVARTPQVVPIVLSEDAASEREQAFLEALAQGRDLPVQPTIQDLERYAPDWADLVPDDPGMRAGVAHLLGSKHAFTHQAVPRLRSALGLDTEAVGHAYEGLYGTSLATIYAPRVRPADRLRWAASRLSGRLDALPAFWLAFVVTLIIGAVNLALPIAVAGVGALPGIALIVVLGLINLVTVVAMVEVVTRSGSIRYGNAFIGTVVADYLGTHRLGDPLGGADRFLVRHPADLLHRHLDDPGRCDGAARGGLDDPAVPGRALLPDPRVAERHGRLDHRDHHDQYRLAAGDLGTGLLAPAAGEPHVREPPLERRRLICSGAAGGADRGHSRPLRGAHPGRHLWQDAAPARPHRALRRPGTRRGHRASRCVLNIVWVLAVCGAVAPEVLAAQSSTVLVPLAAVVGPQVQVLGAIFVVLSMGLGLIQFSLALFNLARERIGQRFARGGSRGRFLLSLIPVILVLLVAEWMVLTDTGSFAGILGFLGVMVHSLMSGIFPALLLVASRRKGELVPGVSYRALGHPLVVGGIYLLFLSNLFLHGLVIWEHPLQRAGGVLVGLLMLVVTAAMIRRGAFGPRVVVELRQDRRRAGRSLLAIMAGGQPADAEVRLRDDRRRATVPGLHR